MLTTITQPIIATRKMCAVCSSSQLEVVLDLPHLPLTGRFSQTSIPAEARHQGFDQKLLFCPQCSHAQLIFQISPEELYNSQYYFRTSESDNAQRGTRFFLNTLNEFFSEKKFQCALDVGCNDLFLLQQLESRAHLRYGIDPIWSSKELPAGSHSGIKVLGECIESVELKALLTTSLDLIIFRHTLEHIYSPKMVLEKIIECSADDAVFAIEVPCFDTLLRRLRFDQILHEHLQYFSFASLQRLIEDLGCTYLGYRENYHDWGAVCVLFQKSKQNTRYPPVLPSPHTRQTPTTDDIKSSYTAFHQEMSLASRTLEFFKGEKIYGYGASNMIPTLAYHLKNDLSCLESVLDDNPAKHGLYYWNLPLQVVQSESVPKVNEKNIFLTALDQTGPILNRLLKNRPRHIIYPLPII